MWECSPQNSRLGSIAMRWMASATSASVTGTTSFSSLSPSSFGASMFGNLLHALDPGPLLTTWRTRRDRLPMLGAVAESVTVAARVQLVDTSSNALGIVIMVLLLAAGLHTYLTRKTSKPPKWMGKLEEATPKMSFRLGLLLLGTAVPARAQSLDPRFFVNTPVGMNFLLAGYGPSGVFIGFASSRRELE